MASPRCIVPLSDVANCPPAPPSRPKSCSCPRLCAASGSASLTPALCSITHALASHPPSLSRSKRALLISCHTPPAQEAQMITSETLLCDHLVRHNISVNLASMCLVRVRTNGLVGTLQGQSDLVYPPRGRPLGCRGLQFVDGESDMLNACNGRSCGARLPSWTASARPARELRVLLSQQHVQHHHRAMTRQQQP